MPYFYEDKERLRGEVERVWKYPRLVGAGLIGLFLLLWVPTFFAILGTGKVGVVTSFNRVTGRELTEGFNLKAPWPIEQVHDFDIRVQKEEVDTAAATSDLQDARAKLAVNYHLDRGQVATIYKTIGVDYKARLVDPAIQEVFKATTAKFTASELITKRQEVKDQARKALEERLHPRGIIVDDISIVNFNFSAEFNKAIESAQVAKQQVVQAQQELEKARVDADKRVAEARAEAEAQRLKRETLTPELVQLKAIEKWNGVMPTYVTGGSNGGGGLIFNIPTQK